MSEPTEMLVCWRNGRPAWARACTGKDTCRVMLGKIQAMTGFVQASDPDGIVGIRNSSGNSTTVMSQGDGEDGYTYVNFITSGDIVSIRRINELKEIVPPYRAAEDALAEARRMAEEGRRMAEEGRRMAEEARAEAQRMAAEAQHMIRDARQSIDIDEFRRRIAKTMDDARAAAGTMSRSTTTAPRVPTEPTKLDRILGNLKKLIFKDKSDDTKGTESGSGGGSDPAQGTGVAAVDRG